MGGIGVPEYNGSVLAAKQNVIVVAIQYRLGALGFLAAGDIQGQFGVLDQRLALAWVQENIASFGGDKEQVTIFGQSAGGSSVAFHLVSQGSWSLFKYAILESPPSGWPTFSYQGAV